MTHQCKKLPVTMKMWMQFNVMPRTLLSDDDFDQVCSDCSQNIRLLAACHQRTFEGIQRKTSTVNRRVRMIVDQPFLSKVRNFNSSYSLSIECPNVIQQWNEVKLSSCHEMNYR